MRKVIELEDYVTQKRDKENKIEKLYELVEKDLAATEDMRTRLFDKSIRDREIIEEQKKIIENQNKKNSWLLGKIKKGIPVHIVVYLMITFSIFLLAVTTLVEQIYFQIYIIKYFTLFATMIGSLTLFFTALFAIKDWKGFIKDNGEK